MASERFKITIPNSDPNIHLFTKKMESKVPHPTAPKYLTQPGLWSKCKDSFSHCLQNQEGPIDPPTLASLAKSEINRRSGGAFFSVVPCQGILGFELPYLFVKVNTRLDFLAILAIDKLM